MTELEKLKQELGVFFIECGEESWLDAMARYVKEDRERIVEPLVKAKEAGLQMNETVSAIKETLLNAGIQF